MHIKRNYNTVDIIRRTSYEIAVVIYAHTAGLQTCLKVFHRTTKKASLGNLYCAQQMCQEMSRKFAPSLNHHPKGQEQGQAEGGAEGQASFFWK